MLRFCMETHTVVLASRSHASVGWLMVQTGRVGRRSTISAINVSVRRVVLSFAKHVVHDLSKALLMAEDTTILAEVIPGLREGVVTILPKTDMSPILHLLPTLECNQILLVGRLTDLA